MFNIFGFIKHNPKLTVHMDPTLPEIDYEVFNMCHDGFEEHYRDAEEQIPNDAPEGRRLSIYITCYVDASHAANKVTRKSHTGILIFLNRTPIHWYSKKTADGGDQRL